MKNIILLVALIASLIFNGFFIGTYLNKKFAAEGLPKNHQERVEFIAKKLNLSDIQKENLIVTRNEIHKTLRENRKKNKKLRQEINKKLAKNPDNIEQLTPLLHELNKNRLHNQNIFIQNMAKFLKTLNPKQKEAYLELINRKELWKLFRSDRKKFESR